MKMKKVTGAILSVLMLTAVAFTGCGKDAKSTDGKVADTKNSTKVGFIYIGPVGDGGWTYSHDQGRKAVEKELGISTIIKESVPEGQEVEKVMEDMISQDCNIIIGTSFGYMDYMEKVAKRHPDVKFLHCSGYKTSENMSNYFGRIEEPRYLSGIVAAMKSKTNKIGYVGAFEIPEVVRGINAFTLGVRSVKSDAVVKVKWTHTWYDPAKEKEAAKALLDEGVDIITQHQDTAGPQQAAEEKGAFSIGYNSDMKDKAPKAYMTAPVWNWGSYYTEQIKAVMDGTWKSSSYWGGMDTGVVDLAPLTENAPEGAKEKVEKVKADIKAGKFKVFAGPIKDQSGKERVGTGKVLSDEEQLKCDWFVEGVEGKVK